MHLGIDFLRILVDSGGQVGAMRPPKRPNAPQLGATDSPEAAQEMPKTAQEPPKSCLNSLQEVARRCLGARFCPRAAQEVPKGHPAPFQTSILDHVLTMLDHCRWTSIRIWKGFSMTCRLYRCVPRPPLIKRKCAGGNAACRAEDI